MITKKEKDKKPKKLTEPQLEIIRFLGRGHHIYSDHRGKWRMSARKLSDGKWESAKSGHTNANYSDGAGGTHLYRPTVVFLIVIGIVIKDPNKETCYEECCIRRGSYSNEHYILNEKCEDYIDDIKIAMVEGALGVTRKIGSK